MNHLAIVLHLATTEAIGAASTYDQLSKAHLEELARARANRTAGVIDFAGLLSHEQRTFKMQAIPHHIKPVNEHPLKKKKKKERGERNDLAPKERIFEEAGR